MLFQFDNAQQFVNVFYPFFENMYSKEGLEFIYNEFSFNDDDYDNLGVIPYISFIYYNFIEHNRYRLLNLHNDWKQFFDNISENEIREWNRNNHLWDYGELTEHDIDTIKFEILIDAFYDRYHMQLTNNNCNLIYVELPYQFN